ncbi:venom metalloproteinase antarease-like TtrivMP_A [Rhipicephalus sanguineus]|uniref:venom metalloproteinase antarease-like TtrivMP_A n=1 Tax=Rhipicephalus sanguineus TaxID=34632 RepID=UPI0018961660|nr:venom metalloproteinase antarease-like TtrivMP_A [Rhipicephalus sanguineus]
MLAFIVFLRSMVPCYAAAKEFYTYPRLLQERRTAGGLVLQLTEKITLNLEKSTVLAENLVFVTSSKRLNEMENVNTSRIQENLFHDTHYQSSVMVRETDGTVEVEGIVNDNLRIKPLQEAQRSLQGDILHKIYEIPDINERFIDVASKTQYLKKGNNGRHSKGHSKKQHAPRTVHEPVSGMKTFTVEVHVISDKAHQQDFQGNEALISYMAVMTNAVNLRYLEMASPKIKFILVGVTRTKNHDFASSDGSTIDAEKMLYGLRRYYNQGKVPGKPDVVFLLTGFDMTDIQKGKLDRSLKGQAALGGVCTPSAVGEGEDIALSYSGVNTMAHELAHSLGSDHDETPECPWSMGYLMSYVDGGLRKYKLSPCSQKAITRRVTNLPSDCIKVVSEKNYLTHQKRVPGQTVRADYFCKRVFTREARGKKVKARKTLNCKIKCCSDAGSFVNCKTYDMLDGMECTPGKTCKRGVCGKHEWFH